MFFTLFAQIISGFISIVDQPLLHLVLDLKFCYNIPNREILRVIISSNEIDLIFFLTRLSNLVTRTSFVLRS